MIIDKMNKLKNLTNQEQTVRNYINENPRAIIDMGIMELAQNSYTSKSTVLRLCKKVNLTGYAELRRIYTNEFEKFMNQQEVLRKNVFNKTTSIDDIVETIPHLYMQAVEHTQSMFDRNTLIRITNLMKRAQRIEIYGDGFNFDLAQTIAFRLEAVNKDCHVYSAPHHEHVKFLSNRNEKTLVVLLSHTGQNPMTLLAARMYSGPQFHTLAITCDQDSKLAKSADDHIEIIHLGSELNFKSTVYMICVCYIFDIAMASLMVHDLDNISEALVKNMNIDW